MTAKSRNLFARIARGRFTSLLVAIFAFILIHPLIVEEGLKGKAVANVFLFALVLTSLQAVFRRTRLMWFIYAAAALSLCIDWVSFFHPEMASVNVLQSLTHVVVFVAVTTLILTYVLGEGEIDFDRIAAAVCVYIFIGLIWADLFEIVELLRPGSLSIAEGFGDTPSVPILYFSFVTLTSLGYGDINPVHGFSRALAYTEAMVGQLYLAILIARLIGSFVGRRGFGSDSDGSC